MNKVILMGRLTKDAVLAYGGGNNTAIVKFTLAVDRRYKHEGEANADFISCVAFGKTAEFLGKYGTKGIKFVVEGRIQTGNYSNKEGNKVYTTDVVVENIEFAESKSNNAQTTPQPDGDGFLEIPDGADELIPFN